MSIGLYDYDFMTYTHVPFNLELMKLAAYYKKRKEVVIMMPFLDPPRHQKVFIRKDYDDGIFDKKLFEPNVVYGGRAFSCEEYVPLEREIEETYPDKMLYEKYRDNFCITKNYEKIFRQMQNAEHLRISLDGKTVWNKFLNPFNPTKQTKTLIFHDYDLNKIAGGFEAVQEALSRLNENHIQGRLIGMKFPVQVSNVKDMEKWCSLNPSSDLFSLQYNGIMENETFDFLLKKVRPNTGNKLQYNLTPKGSTEEDFINNLPIIYKQCLLARTQGYIISLKYEEGFSQNYLWGKLIKLINNYVNLNKEFLNKIYEPRFRDLSNTYSLYRYITHDKFHYQGSYDQFPVEELREIFQLVREKSYETFKMFYETVKVEYKGGQIIERI